MRLYLLKKKLISHRYLDGERKPSGYVVHPQSYNIYTKKRLLCRPPSYLQCAHILSYTNEWFFHVQKLSGMPRHFVIVARGLPLPFKSVHIGCTVVYGIYIYI